MFFIKHTSDGAFLAAYHRDIANEGMDDPTSWSENKAKAKKFKTFDAAAKLMDGTRTLCGFQPAQIVEG
jgi:hypothetical protein